MRFKEYEWDDINIPHICRHAVTPQEVEEACFNAPLIIKGGTNRYLVYGRSDSGRYLFIVAIYKDKNAIRPITARNMTDVERRLYNKKRG